MTLRSVIIGLIIGIFVSAFTYYNDAVIRQSLFVGNHFPPSVMGFITLLIILFNPLMSKFRKLKLISTKEITVIAALSLSVCGWPGLSFFYNLSGIVSVPSKSLSTKSSWKAQNVMSYVPGVSSELGEGHVRNFPSFLTIIKNSQKENKNTPAKRIWNNLSKPMQELAEKVSDEQKISSSDKMLFIKSFNKILAIPDFYTPETFSEKKIPQSILKYKTTTNATKRDIIKFNRSLLAYYFPNYIAKAPRGNGILLANGDFSDPAVQKLFQGQSGDKKISVKNIPWKTWFPVIMFWGSLAVLLGLSSLFLVVIVQPQWKRELLPYPIARFVKDFAQVDPDTKLPRIVGKKLFWYGLITVSFIHLINGLHAWFPSFVEIPNNLDFSSLQQIFPIARQVDFGNFIIWNPYIFPTVIAFAFLVSTEVSFSVGISGILYMMFASLMISSGINLENSFYDAKNMPLMRFGAFAGTAATILFVGRHYYINIIKGTIGLKTEAEIPKHSIWASRLLITTSVCMIAILNYNGLDWFIGTLLIAITLLMFLVITRINVESGVFFMQSYWAPLGVITALFGTGSLSPTVYIMGALFMSVLAIDTREIVMPFIANSLYLADDTTQSKKSSPWIPILAGMLLLSFIVALIATLYNQYNHGLNLFDTFATKSLPEVPFDNLANHISELSAYNDLIPSFDIHGFQYLTHMRPMWNLFGWIAFGFLLVVGTGMMRIRFSWWPLHSIVFLVWGTYPGTKIAFSFLIGWILKSTIVKISGIKGFRIVKDFMIGIIAGEVLSSFAWTAYGTIFNLITGLVPAQIKIFP